VAGRTLVVASEVGTLAGVACRVRAETARALHVVLHAAQHGPTDERVLDDLELTLERVKPEIWPRVVELARRLDATDAFVAGLELSPDGRALVTRLELPPVGTAAAALRSAG